MDVYLLDIYIYSKTDLYVYLPHPVVITFKFLSIVYFSPN